MGLDMIICCLVLYKRAFFPVRSFTSCREILNMWQVAFSVWLPVLTIPTRITSDNPSYFLSPPLHSVSVSQCTLVRLVSRLAMPAGSFTAWNMGSSRTDWCPVTRPEEEEMIPSTPSSVRLELESTSPGLFLWTWSPLSLVSVTPRRALNKKISDHCKPIWCNICLSLL